MGGAMSLGMQRQMTAVAILLAGGLLGAGCGHRAGANPSSIAALQPPAPFQPGGFKPTAKLDSVLLMTPKADGQFSAARVDMKQVVSIGVPERVRLHPNDVIYVPRTWIADMDLVVDQYVRGLIPSLPRVGAGVQVN